LGGNKLIIILIQLQDRNDSATLKSWLNYAVNQNLV